MLKFTEPTDYQSDDRTMRKLSLLPIVLLLCSAPILSCDKESPCPTCENYTDGFVIGYDPCTGFGNPNSGIVINIPSKGDTVVAYNFPIGIYEFPSNRGNPFFAEEASADFPVKIKYRYPREDEKSVIFCRGNILVYPFFINNENEVILLSVTK